MLCVSKNLYGVFQFQYFQLSLKTEHDRNSRNLLNKPVNLIIEPRQNDFPNVYITKGNAA